MIPFLLYIIKLSICLILFYVGYKFLLSHETFFHFNRKILLTGMLACMLLPLIKVRTETTGIIQRPMIQLEKIMTEEEFPLSFAASNETIISPISAGKQNLPVSFAHLLALIFVTGCFISLCMLIRSHISLYLLIKSGRKVRRGSNTFVLLDSPVIPFNYGPYIILSEKDYHDCPDIILTHELAHYQFYHSFDIILVELLILLQWFNPFVRLLKKEIRKVHEFQADSEVLKTGVDATNYQLLLVKKAVVFRPYTFANNFNNNKLKIRFTMMTKKQSNRWARLKFLLLLPVAALFVYACARPNENQNLEHMKQGQNMTSVSIEPTDEPLISLEFVDNTGKKLRSFNFTNNVIVGSSLDLESSSIRKLEEWIKSHKRGDFQYCTVSIRASGETPMGVITDLKQLLRNAYLLKISYRAIN